MVMLLFFKNYILRNIFNRLMAWVNSMFFNITNWDLNLLRSLSIWISRIIRNQKSRIAFEILQVTVHFLQVLIRNLKRWFNSKTGSRWENYYVLVQWHNSLVKLNNLVLTNEGWTVLQPNWSEACDLPKTDENNNKLLTVQQKCNTNYVIRLWLILIQFSSWNFSLQFSGDRERKNLIKFLSNKATPFWCDIISKDVPSQPSDVTRIFVLHNFLNITDTYYESWKS